MGEGLVAEAEVVGVEVEVVGAGVVEGAGIGVTEVGVGRA